MAVEKLQAENEELRRRLEEAEETIRAIQQGAVDAFVVEEPAGHRVYTLNAADRPYRLFVEEMQQGAATLHADGTIVFCNRRLADLLKVPHEKLIGAALHDFIATDDRSIYNDLLWQGQTRSGRGEARLRQANGELVPAYLTLNALPIDCGAVIGVLVTDLTTQRHHEQLTAAHNALGKSEAKYKAIFETVGVSLWEEDFSAVQAAVEALRSQGVVEFRRYFAEHPEFVRNAMSLIQVLDVNRATIKMFEADDKSHLLGSLPAIFVPESLPVFVEELVTVAEGRTYMEAEALLHTVAGRPIHVLFSMRLPPPTEKLDRVLFSVTDITDRIKAEDKLRQLAADLSEANRRKNEFLAMLAHELRNPLAPVRNAAHILRLKGPATSELQWAREVIDRQMSHMTRLIDDLLDVSRIDRGKIQLRRERIELAAIIRNAVDAARPSCESNGLELIVTLPPEPIFVSADPTRMVQVIGNLLNNACKFTDQGGCIGLTVEREDKQAVIRVRDSGIGIAADQLLRIFDMFMQVDTSLERSTSGLGIGLTLVKNLLEMHGGTVEARSAGVGQGSEFAVRLPLLGDEEREARSEKEESDFALTPRPSSLAPLRRILVVDDNRDSAESLAMLLKLTGNEAHIAYDGLEAVEAAATFKPNVVLLDIGLPKLNGYEACRRIREQPWGKGMMLVALTGWGQEEDRQRSAEAGFDSHLVKPVDFKSLMKLLAGSAAG